MAWFDELMGCSAQEWAARGFSLDSLPPRFYETCGEFSTPSLKSLWDDVRLRDKNSVLPQLQVRTRTKWDTHVPLFDTSAMQVRAGRKSMFQVASNYNCLEVASEYTDPFDPSFIMGLARDPTQGPSACGAITAAILRLGLHRKHPINLLQDTDLEQRNGKCRCNTSITTFKSMDRMRVGMHVDVTPIFDRSGDELVPAGPDVHPIDQVFTSTCVQKALQGSAMAQTCLDAAYEGTYLCAAVRHTETLVLTAVGGGHFRNHPRQIARAIARAHRLVGPYLQSKCQVVLPLYEPVGRGCTNGMLESLRPLDFFHHITM